MPEGWQQLAAVATTLGVEAGDIALFARAAEAVSRAEALDPTGFGTLFAKLPALTLHRFDEALEHGRWPRSRQPVQHRGARHRRRRPGRARPLRGRRGRPAANARPRSRAPCARPHVLPPRAPRGSPRCPQAMQQAEAAGEPAGYRTAVGRFAHRTPPPAAWPARRRRRRLPPGRHRRTRLRAGPARHRHPPGRAGRRRRRHRSPPHHRRAERCRRPRCSATCCGSPVATPEAAGADALVTANFAGEEAVGHITDLDRAGFEVDRTDDHDEAVRLARFADSIRPDNVSANDVLGWALVRDGRARGAPVRGGVTAARHGRSGHQDTRRRRVRRGGEPEPSGRRAARRRSASRGPRSSSTTSPKRSPPSSTCRCPTAGSPGAPSRRLLDVGRRPARRSTVSYHRRRDGPTGASCEPREPFAQVSYSIRRPLIALEMTSCWICSVPSKMSMILASRWKRSTGYSRT